MSVTQFPDGIKVGPDIDGGYRETLYDFNEVFVPGVDHGTLAAGEVKTITLDVTGGGVRGGSTIIARPLSPAYFPYLTIKHAWLSADNEVSVMIKNDSDSEQPCLVQDMWSITAFTTSSPPSP